MAGGLFGHLYVVVNCDQDRFVPTSCGTSMFPSSSLVPPVRGLGVSRAGDHLVWGVTQSIFGTGN